MSPLKSVAFFLLIVGWVHSSSIVFVHIGGSIPEHFSYTAAQARLFNPTCPIFLIANQHALKTQEKMLHQHQVTFVACESLTPSPKHQKYSKYARTWRGGHFWVYTSERFFYLEEFLQQYQLTDVFHLENDILLFANLDELLPVFKKHYNGMIGATFENDQRGVAGLMYIPHPDLLSLFSLSFPEGPAEGATDMETLAKFKEKYHKKYIDNLPIIPPDYAKDHPLRFLGQISKEPEAFSNHFEDFGAVFDAAAWGVYLGGWDAQYHAACSPGAISPYCVFDPSLFGFHWGVDEEGRTVPYAVYRDQTVRILNLHVTNKIRIPSFCSQ